MNRPLELLLGIHNHQPEGNFGHVFSQCYADCYGPLVDALLDAPHVKVALHHTGPLLEWIERERRDYFDKVRVLVGRGQAELLGGGFYEPMLAVLPERDARGQIHLMSDYLETHFGVRPRGMWLAERVWEPALAQLIAESGMAFTLVDDGHFRAAGLEGLLRGYYVTEKAGVPLALFPIDKLLRETIPFSEAPTCMKGLLALRAETPDDLPTACTYGDDGEKFGVWPGTNAWVWGRDGKPGWLRDFFGLLHQHRDVVQTTTFSAFLDANPPSGRVYLPTASYEEMGEWALPASAQGRYNALRKDLESRKELDEAKPFLHGGIWQNFLAKYPESNTMHKKMVQVSRLVARAEAAGHELPEATRSLYRAQCNCAYWHGLFGGLYLNYLRDTLYHHLIDAELAAEKALGIGGAGIELADLDADLRQEVRLFNDHAAVYVKPDQGGAVYELDFRPKRFNLLNVLSRRPEGYHAKLAAAAKAPAKKDTGAVQSIHDLTQLKSTGLDQLLVYDRHPRHAFVEHVFANDLSLAKLTAGDYVERGDFAGAPFVVVGHDAGSVRLRRQGHIDGRPATVEKTIWLDGNRLGCRWHIESPGTPIEVTFAPELTLTLLAGDAQDRYFRVADGATLGDRRLASHGELPPNADLALVNEWDSFEVKVAPNPPAPIWRYPLETASQSEAGFERTYQGSVLVVPYRDVTLGDGRSFECAVELQLVDTVAR